MSICGLLPDSLLKVLRLYTSTALHIVTSSLKTSLFLLMVVAFRSLTIASPFSQMAVETNPVVWLVLKGIWHLKSPWVMITMPCVLTFGHPGRPWKCCARSVAHPCKAAFIVKVSRELMAADPLVRPTMSDVLTHMAGFDSLPSERPQIRFTSPLIVAEARS
ncbi:hypothetical protein J3R82DRAFT_2787 [Butyriboletus roseoflavus]|nr:hypothetical protein J3R82DRAFT_2787 [Butyriboletus roseoflavus]